MARSAGHSTLPCAYLFEPAEPKPEVDLPSGAHEMGRRGESFAQADSIVGSAVFSLHSPPLPSSCRSKHSTADVLLEFIPLCAPSYPPHTHGKISPPRMSKVREFGQALLLYTYVWIACLCLRHCSSTPLCVCSKRAAAAYCFGCAMGRTRLPASERSREVKPTVPCKSIAAALSSLPRTLHTGPGWRALIIRC